jgi:hypothetical protein
MGLPLAGEELSHVRGRERITHNPRLEQVGEADPVQHLVADAVDHGEGDLGAVLVGSMWTRNGRDGCGRWNS